MFSSEYSHGATSGSASATFHGSFTGTEGPEAANRLVTAIKIDLGQLNSLQVLTTPLSDLVAQFPSPDTATARIEIFKMEEKLMERWNRAYWRVRSFFTPGSPAADQIKVFDDTADLPELWRTFNIHYVAAANFSGLFSVFDQLYGPAFVQKNLLAEFVRQNDLQKRILLLKEQPHVNFMQTPRKALFQSPLTRRVLDLDSTKDKEKETETLSSSSVSEEGGSKEGSFLSHL